MAEVVQVNWTYKLAIPQRDSEEFRTLVERMFEESNTENIGREITKEGGEWSPDDVRHQLIVWLVECAQRGDFPAGDVDEDYDVIEIGTTPLD